MTRIRCGELFILVGVLLTGCSSSGGGAQQDLAPPAGGEDLAPPPGGDDLARPGGGGDLGPAPPAPPTNVSASKGTSAAAVTVTWDASAGATSYRVYRGGTQIAEVTALGYDDTAAATAVPGAPTGLAASDGTFADHIALVFTAPALVAGPAYAYTVTALNAGGESAPSAADSGFRAGSISSFNIYRDGALVGSVTTPAYDDATATLGVPGAPRSLTASTGSFNGVGLNWQVALTAVGPTHTYVVAAVNDAGEGAKSASDTGYGASAPVTAYELSIDGGATFTSIGNVVTYLDTTAPSGTITPGVVTASKGRSLQYIFVTATASTTSPGAARTYLLRARNAAGAGPTASATGARAVGAPSFVWQRSAGDSDASYATAGNLSGASDFDAYGPATGGRYYRILVSAPGATSVASAADRGYRVGVRRDLWSVAGEVDAMALSGTTLYLGGRFRAVGPPLANFGVVDATTGVADTGRVHIRPGVDVVVSDGAGGQYVGIDTSTSGTLSWGDGVFINRLVHVLPDGTIDPAFTASLNGSIVRALALSGSTLYVAGDFGRIGAATRSGFGAVDASSGQPLAFNPAVNGAVNAITVAGSTVYIGGSFTSAGGATRNRIAALDATTGNATAWDPNADGPVSAIAVTGSTVYAGGSFANIGGQARNRIAALDATSGLATSWNPNADGAVNALAVAGATVYAGGSFANIGGQARSNVAALDAGGSATSWSPAIGGAVLALAVSGTTVYVGADAPVADAPCTGLTAVDATTGAATSWQPNACGPVRSIAVYGTKLALGGTFSTVGGVARDRIAAIDLVAGSATAWNPGADGKVSALAVSGGTVFAGGQFANIGGQARAWVAALDATSGAATAWNAGADGEVLAMAPSGSLLYVGGNFMNIGGQARSNAAALDLATAAAGAWNPIVGECCDTNPHQVNAIAVAGGNVWIGGQFTAAGGTGAGNQHLYLAATDATTGAVQPWSLDLDGPVHALAATATTMYVGGSFTQAAGQARPQQAAFDAATGGLTAWNPNPPGTAPGGIGVYTLAAAGSLVYAGGGFSWIGGSGGSPRFNVASTDATSGAASSFAPELSNNVFAIVVAGGTVLVGGSFGSASPFTNAGLVALSP